MMPAIKYIVLALGSNVGDSPAILGEARRRLEERIGPIIARTEVVRTAAWGLEEQPDFYNQVLVLQPGVLVATWAPRATLGERLHALLDITQGIETELGRRRLVHWGPRTCDIDIIFVDDLDFTSERLLLPHPWWRERDFVGGLIERELPDFLFFAPR